jgi:hypothetical protein
MKKANKQRIRRDRRKAKASKWHREGRGKNRKGTGHGFNVGSA